MVSATPADDAVGPAAEIAGGDAGEAAHGEDQRHRRERDDEIEPGRHHHAAEDVAAELIGAEPVRKRRRLERRRGVARQRIVRHDIRPDQRAQRDQHEQREGKPGDRIFRRSI